MGEVTDWIKANVMLSISIVFIFFLILGLSYFYLHSAQPTLLKEERQNYKASYQYVESKDTELINFVNDYNGWEIQKRKYIATNATYYAKVIEQISTTQAGLADQIYTDVELVPDQSKLPESVKQFLIKHPNPRGG